MNLFNDSIIKLPQGLSETAFYKLVSLFDQEIVKDYQVRFEREDDYKAVFNSLKYFYTYPEANEEDSRIDLEYLTMLVMSGKATRNFVQYFSPELGRFNFNGPPDMIQTSKENPYNIELEHVTIVAPDTTEALGMVNNLINHLLYFHSLEILIDSFIHIIELIYNNKDFYRSQNINAIYYESI